jgi:probable HAF family extracellular repeat protein
MKRIVLGACALTGLIACDLSTRPEESPVNQPGPSFGIVAQGFTVKNLGTLGGAFSGANAINELGEVAGFAALASGEARAMLWRRGIGMRSLGTLGGADSRARDINDRSEVVGHSETRPGSDVNRAFLWSESGGMRGIGSLGGRNSFANAINNRREVVGGSDTRSGSSRAFIWDRERGMRSLGTLGGRNSQASDINDATQVVGVSETADGDGHAFLWTRGRGMEDLGTLGGRNSQAGAISPSGEVVGSSETADGTVELFLWTPANGMRSLGRPEDAEDVTATSINSHRRVVGITFPSGEIDDLPLLWTAGSGIHPLPTLGGPNGQAQDLNEFGQIVGTTWTSRDGIRATLWTPTEGPLVVASMDEDQADDTATR